MSAKTRIKRPTTATPTKRREGAYVFVSKGLSTNESGKPIVSPNKGSTYRNTWGSVNR